MTDFYVIGIDPGPTPGLVGLRLIRNTIAGIDAIQFTQRTLGPILDSLAVYEAKPSIKLAVEAYVVGRRSTRVTHVSASRETRELVERCKLWAERNGIYWIARTAGEVKPWATDTRLLAAGILPACVGMRHARDAGRHALFAACHDFGLPDPLSKKANR